MWVSRFLILGKFATPALRKLYQQTLARLPPTTVREHLRAILECDVTAAVANVRVPVLCLTAKHDRLIPNAAAHLIHHQSIGGQRQGFTVAASAYVPEGLCRRCSNSPIRSADLDAGSAAAGAANAGAFTVGDNLDPE